MISIQGEMRDLINNSLKDRLVCVVGSASKEGIPQISLKGSVAVFDDETLSYWERARRSSLENISENPNVVIFYRNPDKHINWRFHGTVSLHEDGATREKVMGITPQAELDRDPDRTGLAVLVHIQKITELSGNVLQEK